MNEPERFGVREKETFKNMKYAEINKEYTQVIAEYLNKGYVINTSTQSGTYSNEIAHCDLTSGDDLVRVVLVNCYQD
jgi:hypothetical protein